MSKGAMFLCIGLPTALVGVGGWLFWPMIVNLWAPDIPPASIEVKKGEEKEATLDDALALMCTARQNFANVNDYTCRFVREERIRPKDTKTIPSQIVMKARHEPFSVLMEWRSPQDKHGQMALWVDGENDGCMCLKNVPLLPSKVKPDNFLVMTQTRRKITEAGLRKMIDRFCNRWEEEKKLGLTKVSVSDAEVTASFKDAEDGPANVRKHKCTLVTTVHDPKYKDTFVKNNVTFYRTLVYFDRESGLPIRMQGYDWPKSESDKEGMLMEDYTYLDIKTNVGLTAADFKW